MPLNAELLAQKLWAINGPVLDANSAPQPPTDAIKKYASGFIKMLTAGLVSHLPGTVTATTVSGAPITAGVASGGKILGLAGPVMALEASGGNPVVAATLLIEATAIATYIMGAAMVNFAAGTITGNSTEVGPPTPAPGALVAGAGADGKISGLDGAALANVVKVATLQSGGPTQIQHYTEMCNHVMQMGSVAYMVGTINGVCFNTLVGFGVGGTIS